MMKFEAAVDCPACGYPFGTVAPDECPGCNSEIVGVTRVSEVRYQFDRPVQKGAGDELHLNVKIPPGSRGLVAARRQRKAATDTMPNEQRAAADHAYGQALFDYRIVCESCGVKHMPLEELKARAEREGRSVVQIVDDLKREVIEAYQRDQDRKCDKPLCANCGRAVPRDQLEAGRCNDCKVTP